MTQFRPKWEAVPWEVEKGGTDWNVWGPTPSNHIGTDLEGDFGSEADARLIAAAPDLLDGCNALLGLVDLICMNNAIPSPIRKMLESNHRIDEARAAIAKAT